METVIGLLLPFLGTSLGAGCVYFMKKGMGDRLQRSLTGFAAGVMVAASVWSLLIPAMDYASGMGKLSFLPAVIGFWLGVLFLLLLDSLIPHLHQFSDQAEGPHAGFKRTTMLVLAVVLHNIPEGMALGAVFAGFLSGGGIGLSEAFALSAGIAIQNFPEGAIVSMPLRAAGMGKHTGRFLNGVLSGAVEPVAAAVTIAAYRAAAPGDALPPQLCRRGDGLCRRRGADPRDVRRGAFQRRHPLLCGRGLR